MYIYRSYGKREIVVLGIIYKEPHCVVSAVSTKIQGRVRPHSGNGRSPKANDKDEECTRNI